VTRPARRLVALLLAASVVSVAAVPPDGGVAVAAGHQVTTSCTDALLVERDPGTAVSSAEVSGARVTDDLGGGLAVVEVEPEDRDEVVVALGRDPDVREVVRDVPLVPATVTTGEQRVLHNEQLAAIGAPRAWLRSEGRRAVRVAVLDEAVDLDHPALRTATALPSGLPPIDGGPSAAPTAHGTHVAGIVAGADGASTVGVAPGITLLTSDVFCATELVRAIRAAVERDVRVINLSLVLDYGTTAAGAPRPPPVADVAFYTRMFEQVLGPRTLVVAAAGNTASTTIPLPAAVDHPQVLSVAASDGDGLASFSNRNAGRVDLAAPGRSIRSTTPGGGYARMSGTSMAAPHVTGAAALLASLRTDASATSLARLLTGSTRRPQALAGTSSSGGVLHVGRAVAYLDGEHGACPTWLTPRARFLDVDRTSVHGPSVACIGWWRITLGRTPDRFDPSAEVTRGEMAAFLARVLDQGGVLPASAPDAFRDDDGTPHERAIDRLAAVGVVQGTGDGRFRPNASVTRAQMASFLDRSLQRLLDRPLPAPDAGFRDVPPGPHRRSVDVVAGLDIAKGTSATTYRPLAAVTRAQMASFLARTLDVAVREQAVEPRL
jgi:subtilisin family serine protease